MTRVKLRIGDSSRHRTAALHGHRIDALQDGDEVWHAALRQAPHRVLRRARKLSDLETALARFTPEELATVLQGRPLTTTR